jgi:hypothetical protein
VRITELNINTTQTRTGSNHESELYLFMVSVTTLPVAKVVKGQLIRKNLAGICGGTICGSNPVHDFRHGTKPP